MTTLLSIRRLQKQYGSEPLFSIDRLDIEPATAYVLTGANGTGKSTLLRILAGLESADLQQVQFNGDTMRMQPYPPAMRDAIVYVHQHPVMFAGSVEKNIGYGLKARGMARDEIALQVAEAMQWAGVAHLCQRDPAVLSGGEKQRIALARAKVLEPQLLLLDEPTASLDGAAREQVLALIPALIQEGRSVVIACHDRDLIGLPGVQRLKLKEGRLQRRQAVNGRPHLALVGGTQHHERQS